jgi:hypothetical protein
VNPALVTAPLPSVQEHIQEIDRQITRVLGLVRDQSATWEIPDRLAEGRPTPPWFELPVWLDEAWGGEPGKRPAPELPQILWGQYALFLFIRIQDDLLDRQRNDLPSLLVADRFLVESLESFRRLDQLDRGFWHSYDGWLQDTVEGISEVAALESVAGRFTTHHLGLHARVAAIFKAGTRALCRCHDRERDWPWIEGLLDQLAIFSQIGDDLHDLSEDVGTGRYTWPANVLLGNHESPAIEEQSQSVGQWAHRLQRTNVILDQLREVAGAAVALVPSTAPEPVQELAAALVSRVLEMERDLHESMVREVFPTIPRPSRP